MSGSSVSCSSSVAAACDVTATIGAGGYALTAPVTLCLGGGTWLDQPPRLFVA